MELIEREGYLATLQAKFESIAEGEGHTVLVSGEAGIGKTSLIRAFCKNRKNDCNIYLGTCDALFTPRPLAPLYDIALQMRHDFWQNNGDMSDRVGLFARFFHELSIQEKPSLIVFEDIHWADEATLDFIKFLARRIIQLQCLFILTYRSDEIHSHHPLRNVLGQLNPDTFTRLQLLPLSKLAVEKMADERGYKGEDVFSISGGNPFYVSEILSSYSVGVPDNIKDSIIAAYNRQEERTKQVWELLSVIPGSFEVKYLEKFEPLYAAALERCLESRILFLQDGFIAFKHELFRRTIEANLSPLKRLSLNKRILDLLLESFEQNQAVERIMHHAKNANEYELVVKYAPLAARKAASVGAHVEAGRLYLSAIEYYQGNDQDILIQFYESYAYECYLTNQIREAIIYTGKALNLWKQKNDTEKTGNSMRFMSRLWWFEANRKQAESFGVQAIEVLEHQPLSRAKAMPYSNMSQLKMLSAEADECIFWGEKAIAMAKELDDEEILSHALNNVGTIQMNIPASKLRGIELLQQSLALALKNSYHEHIARAYANLGSIAINIKEYSLATNSLAEGLKYCEERDLDSWSSYMYYQRARMNLETGNWKEAYASAEKLIASEMVSPVIRIGAIAVVATIKFRRGESGMLPLLMESKPMAFETMELQRIIPTISALLEYEWITGHTYVESKELDQTIVLIEKSKNIIAKSVFAFWLRLARKQDMPLNADFEGYDVSTVSRALKAAAFWKKTGCPYEEALTLFEGTLDDKRKALNIIQGLGAQAVFEKLKMEMRRSGIKSIPRGIRKTTQSNPAQLTERELDVLNLLNKGLQNKEIAATLFISAKTVDHHISNILFKLEAKSRAKAVQEAIRLEIIK